MKIRTAATLSTLAAAGVSASWATTWPGAVLHASTTAAALVGTFFGCYFVTNLPPDVRARVDARLAEAEARRPHRPAPVLTVPVEVDADAVHAGWDETEFAYLTATPTDEETTP